MFRAVAWEHCRNAEKGVDRPRIVAVPYIRAVSTLQFQCSGDPFNQCIPLERVVGLRVTCIIMLSL